MMWLAVGALKNIVEHVPFDKWYDNPLTDMFLDGLKTPTSFGTHGLTMVVCFSIWSHWWWQSLFMLNMFFFDDTCAQLSRSFFMYDYMLYTCRYLHYVVISPHMYNYLYCNTYIYIFIILYYIYARGFSGTPWPLYHGSGEAWVSVANSSKPSRIFSNWSFSFLPFSRVGMILWYPLLSYDILWFFHWAPWWGWNPGGTVTWWSSWKMWKIVNEAYEGK